MNDPMLETARTYADEVRVLFAPAGAPAGERGGRGPVSYDALAAQAEKLATISAALTAEAENKLQVADDPAMRAQVSTQLLAKTLTDLNVGAYLLEAAADEETQGNITGGGAAERSTPAWSVDNEALQILSGAGLATRATERGEHPQDVAAVRKELKQTVADVLMLISERASRTGQAAFGALLGIGLAEVGQAAGHLGLGLAQALGQAERVTRFYNYFRTFIARAYDSVIALLGAGLAKQAGEMVVKWLDEIKEAKFFGGLLERLYQTQQTQAALVPLVEASKRDRDELVATIERLETLNEEFKRQVGLVEKLLKGLKYLGGIPVAVLPYGSLVMATIYIALGAYVVLAGADYVDAESLKLLARVDGVRVIVMAGV
jgi:hypothetical protein